MPEADLIALSLTAAAIGVVHTLMGPDHYIPFVAMSKAGRWSLRRTLLVTSACGVGHVLSSILIGALGIALGWTLGGVEAFEGHRGQIAGWLLLGFGLAYMAWGLHRAIKGRTGGHVHLGRKGKVHFHAHGHEGDHQHDQDELPDRQGSMTPWVLFTIFVFGPCEPLIPILMYPAATQSGWGLAIVTAIFALCTIGTMLAVVTIGYFGLARVRFTSVERYSHAVAGLFIALCGAAIQFGL